MIGQYCNSPVPLGNVLKNIGIMLWKRAKNWPEHPVFAWRGGDRYVPVSWSRFLHDVMAVATFLHQKGVKIQDRVAVFSPNSYEMLVWEMAVTSMGAISVPIFAGYDQPHVEFILDNARPVALYVDGEDRLEKVEKGGFSRVIPTLVTRQPSAYVPIGECMKTAPDRSFFLDRLKRVQPYHVCFIQYTSGTTGDPKGVMLTHRNILSQRKALSRIWSIPFGSRFLCYLPWHHSFGGLFERFSALYHGATIYLEDSFGKNLDRLLENWRLVFPTHFFSVPKIYIALITEARLHREMEEILFHPELKFVFTAAAPLPRECGEFFKARGIPVLEGWGLTETSPCVTLTPPGKERVHSYVGEPIPGCEIAISEDNEILVRGPNVMRGYFRNRERTARAIDPYGWFHTGDLGEITTYGLRMICRVDGLFKLSNGEKVSSMMVENCLTITSQWIQHAVAVGDGEEHVAALVFPNMRNLQSWAEQRGRRLPVGWDLARDPEVQNLIRQEIQKNMADFSPKYMRVKSFVIVPKELSLEDGELTPTMKVIRNRVVKKYQGWIDAIYRPSRHPQKSAYVVRLNGG
jgi:long-subunit acyl-CoA synthetase (AMP-forming)